LESSEGATIESEKGKKTETISEETIAKAEISAS
jgi:hypothetical protein